MVIILKTGKEKNMNISFLLKCPIPKSTSNSIVIVSISLRSTTSNHSPILCLKMGENMTFLKLQTFSTLDSMPLNRRCVIHN